MKNQSNSTYTDILKIRISKDLLAKAKKTAKDSELSLSAFVRMILKDYLVAKERKERAIQKDIEKSFEESEKDFEDFIKRYGRVRTPQNDEVRE